MYKVDNKKTLRRLAMDSFRANRMRNLFAVIAIMLTTVLFMSIFTIGNSMSRSMEESLMRQVGTSAHGGFKRLTEEQYEQLKQHKSIKKISYSILLGVAENEELEKTPAEIRCAADELAAEMMFSKPEVGHMPEEKDEIAVNTIVLEKLGIEAELGQEVTLEYSVAGVTHKETFHLSGYWEGDILMPASQIWLSRDYVEEKLDGYEPVNENDYVGFRYADVFFRNSHDINGRMLTVISDSGFDLEEISYGVNWAYNGNGQERQIGADTIFGYVLILLMIVMCGYLIISNVFFLGITKDIQYFGLLKTIGTTGKQLRSIIRMQALWLCLVAVPVGVLAGGFVSVQLIPVVLSVTNVNVVKVSVNVGVLFLTSVFSVLTVLISIAKPSKLASKVSPIEAVRISDGSQSVKRRGKRSGGIHLWSMALGNVVRNKKKALMVILSLALSLTILNASFSVANSFDLDKFISGLIGNDFAIADTGYFNAYVGYENQDTISGDFLNELEQQDGIEMLANIYFHETIAEIDDAICALPEKIDERLEIDGGYFAAVKEEVASGYVCQHIYGLDDGAWERLKIFDGEINIERLKSGDYIVVSAYDEAGKVFTYEVGDSVELVNDVGKKRTYEVMAVVHMPYDITIRHTHPITPEIFMASEVFADDVLEKEPMLTILDVVDEKEEAVENYLSDYCSRINHDMQYESKATIEAEYENTKQSYQIVGTALSILLAVIGMMNFANTIITSIVNRKREVAMLQSIGMTKQQTQIMLMEEGLIYILGAAVLGMTIGSVLGYMGAGAIVGDSFATLRFSVVPSLICLPPLAVIAVLIPYVSQKQVQKKSLVERLRE